jgi:type IV pilus assembly protein PilM
MSDSMWKKEISFGRKPKEPKEPKEKQKKEKAPKPASDSLLKKEISFRRKPKPEVEPAPVAAVEAEVAAPKQSVLKKEISFSRKPKQEKQKKEKAPKPASDSLLKKEISFSRKPKAPKEAPAAKAEKEKTSFLKKEISFGRKKQDRELERLIHAAEETVAPAFTPAAAATAETLPTALAEAAVAAMVEAAQPAPVEAAPVEAAPVEDAPVAAPIAPAAVEPEPSFVEHEPLPELPAVPELDPVVLAAVPDPAPVVLHPVADLPAELPTEFPAEPQPVSVAEDVHAVPVLPVDEAPASIAPLPPALVPAPAEPPPVYETAATAIPPAPVEAAYPEAASVEPVAPEPEPAWVEPVPVAATPIADAVEPWLAEPELPPAPEVPAAVTVHPPVPASELPPLPEAPKVPFWKKELGKKSKAPKQPKAERAPKPTSDGPFWKKELAFGRKKPAAAPVEAVVADAPTEVLEKPKSAPFWKKQVSMSKPSMSLKRSSGGGRKNGHAVKKLVGLKIGASQLAAARVSNNGSAELMQTAREPLAPGIVVGGELRDPDALGEALKAFFAKHKLPKKGVRLGIASNRIGVRIFDIVGVDQEKQLANAVHFRAQEALPIPLDEAVLDYHVLDESVDDEGQTVKRVLLVVAYRELIERYVGACQKAGITLAGIDLEAFALLRALAAPADRGTAALVAVAIGHDRSTFAVSDGRVCEFTRVLEWGGWSLNVALARVFDSTPSEVEAIKRSLALDGTVTPAGLTEEQAAQALDAVRRQVQSFARELVSSLQFYQNQPGSLGIGEIVLTGGTTGLPGLAQELERLIGVHVRVGDPLARVKVAKRAADSDQIGSLAVAIGLGIED